MTAGAAPQTSAAPVAVDPSHQELVRIPLAELHESPLNPRTRYDAQALEELRDSLLQTGQLTPLIVRPRKPGGYEIAAGHRRYRAAKLAVQASPAGAAHYGLNQLLAVVRPLDDRAFIEVLNVENLQRDDLHPLEEAQGFRDLMEKAGYDVGKIAARVGRSTKYVYDRIKLLQLVPAAKKMFFAGEFEAGHAILLARLSPADQQRAIGSGARPHHKYDDVEGGLFEFEDADALDLQDHVKPRSVRELETWIHDHVRMTPDVLDPFLFPETVRLVTQAKEAELTVVHITHDYRVSDAARDEKQRTYGEQSWKRADGKQKSKSCEHSVLGVVVAGPGQGEAFRVCVRKDKCKTHWAAEQKAAVRRAKDRATYGITRTDDRDEARDKRQQAEQARREAENARWAQLGAPLLEALAARLKAAPAGASSAIAQYVLNETDAAPGWHRKQLSKYLALGHTAEDVLRYIAFLNLAGRIEEPYDVAAATKLLKAWGVDVKKIAGDVAPKPAPAKKKAKK